MFNIFKKKKNTDTSDKNKRVMRFGKGHRLGMACFNASDMKIAYGRFGMRIFSRENNDGKRHLAGPKPEGYEPNADMLGFEVFRDVLKVRWHDYNDNELSYEIDLDALFPDKIIPHNKEDEDLIYWDEPYRGDPEIIVEVDDRTLRVYSCITVRVVYPDDRLVHRRDCTQLLEKSF